MKNLPLLSAVAIAVAASACAYAATTDSGALGTQGYLVYGSTSAAKDGDFFGGPSRCSFGVAMDHDQRPVTVDGFKETWKNDSLLVYLGYDPVSWATLQAGVGQTRLDIEDGGRDQKTEWSVGLRLRVLEYLILDPPLGNEPYWLGIEAAGRFSRGLSDGGLGKVSWNQWDGSLTAHLTSKPERRQLLNKIDLFAGPGVSLIDGKREAFRGSDDISEEQAFGILGGLGFYFGSNVSLTFNVASFGDLSYGGELAFHF